MRLLRPLAAAALVLAAATGCGGSDDEPEAAPSSAAAPSDAPAADAPSEAPSEAPVEDADEPEAADDQPVAGEEYVDADGFAITFPEGWELSKDAFGAEVFGLVPEGEQDGFAANVNVFIEALPRQVEVQEYLDASLANLDTFIPGATVESQTVEGDRGILVYGGTVQGNTLKFRAEVLVTDDTAITATFSALPDRFDTDLAAAQPVLDSLRAS